MTTTTKGNNDWCAFLDNLSTIDAMYIDAVDRTNWPSGPWRDEMDFHLWKDHEGFFLIRRNHHTGSLCGYVSVDDQSRWHGLDMGCAVVMDLEVHGGVTFADSIDDEEVVSRIDGLSCRCSDLWWLGFDCAHAFDFMPHVHHDSAVAWDNVADPELRGIRLQAPFGGHLYKDVGFVLDQLYYLALQVRGNAT